jgi:hypothetical protein
MTDNHQTGTAPVAVGIGDRELRVGTLADDFKRLAHSHIKDTSAPADVMAALLLAGAEIGLLHGLQGDAQLILAQVGAALGGDLVVVEPEDMQEAARKLLGSQSDIQPVMVSMWHGLLSEDGLYMGKGARLSPEESTQMREGLASALAAFGAHGLEKSRVIAIEVLTDPRGAGEHVFVFIGHERELYAQVTLCNEHGAHVVEGVPEIDPAQGVPSANNLH